MMKMIKPVKQLYLFKRPEENVDWDEPEGFVICAKNRIHAKTLLPDQRDPNDYSKELKFLEAFPDTVITYLGKAADTVKYGIVLENYNWG